MAKISNEILKDSFFERYRENNLGSYGGFGFSSTSTNPHRHYDYYEITIVISGTYIHTYNDSHYNLGPGTLILMGPRSMHRLYAEPLQAKYFAICIHEDYFLSFVKQHFPDLLSTPIPAYSSIHLQLSDVNYLEQLGQELTIPKPLLCIADMITYLSLMCLFYKKNKSKKDNQQQVQRILDILNDPYYSNVSAQTLYSAVDIPAQALLKSFKEQTGYTLVAYKKKKRLEFAAELLRNSDTKITDIAYDLHYESFSYFLHSFKQEFGMTPTQYRKAHQKRG